jgi:hypothetical protein
MSLNKRRSFKPIIFLSIILNFFLLGILLAPFIMGHPVFPPMPMNPMMVLHQSTSDLSPEGQATMRKIIEEQGRTLTENSDHLKVTFGKMAEQMDRDNPDMDQLHQIIDNIADIQMKIHATMANAIMTMAKQLSADDRRKIKKHIGMPPP